MSKEATSLGEVVSSRELTSWAAANVGVTDEGLRGIWPPFLEIIVFQAFFLPFWPFSGGREEHVGNPTKKRRIKAVFLRYPQISLSPHLLSPPFCSTPN